VTHSTSSLTVRPYRSSDQDRVLELINADRLVGQPVAALEMLEEALAGRSEVDAGWWAELDDLATEVLVDPDGAVQGVLSTAVRPRDDAGLLLWCHGHEDPMIVSTLVGRATDTLADHPTLHAFDFASALTLGLEALPVRHRATTDRALREAGFAGRDLWRYAHRNCPRPSCRSIPRRSSPRGRTRWAGASSVRTGVSRSARWWSRPRCRESGCCRGSASNRPREAEVGPESCWDARCRCWVSTGRVR
jgi:hypothetical protein